MDVENRPGIFAPTQADGSYLYQSGASIYNADKRSRQDVAFTVAYVLLAAVTLFWGIVVFAKTDTNGELYTNGFYNSSMTCDIKQYRAVQTSSTDDDLQTDATFAKAFNKAVAVFLPISAALAIVLSVLYLVLFRRFAKAMVMLSIVVSLVFSLGLGIACFIMGAPVVGIIVIIFAVIAAVFYFAIRRNLTLCAELLALSARSMYENAALVPAAILVKVVGAVILLFYFAAFICALQIGSPKTNPAVYGKNANDEDSQIGKCFDATGNHVDCCVFETKTWAAAYCVFCAIFTSWTTMLILEIKLYTVANTLAQWYFSAPAPGSSAAVGAGGRSNLTRGNVRLALRHCLTTSFGSVAFAAAIMAIINFLRTLARQAARRNIILAIINCFVQSILAALEKFTRFATIATAITGQAFIPSARAVFDTLTRNFLQTYTMWWVPDRVLGFTVFLMSLSWGGIVVGATYGMTKDKGGSTKWGVPVIVGILAFVLMAYLLSFVAGLLLDAINTLYICYAFDKDQRRVTHEEVHNLFAQVPGLAVENPDGNIMYGAPEQTPQPHHHPQQQPYPPMPQQQYAEPYRAGYPVQPAYPPAQGYPPQQVYPLQQGYPPQTDARI